MEWLQGFNASHGSGVIFLFSAENYDNLAFSDLFVSKANISRLSLKKIPGQVIR